MARIVSPRVRWGMTRKQLEQETGCKIILRGRDGAPPTLVMRLRSDHLASLLCTEYHQPRPPWNWPDWVKLSDRKINPRNLFVTAQCAQCAQYVCYIIKLLMTQLINDNWSYSHKNSKCLTPNHWKKYLDVLELKARPSRQTSVPASTARAGQHSGVTLITVNISNWAEPPEVCLRVRISYERSGITC